MLELFAGQQYNLQLSFINMLQKKCITIEENLVTIYIRAHLYNIHS